MTLKLAIFPVQLVVFSEEHLNLHIFEVRYRKLAEDAGREARLGICNRLQMNKHIGYTRELWASQ